MKKTSVVPWETVDVGDEIRATFTFHDVTVTNAGRVANIRHYGHERTFETEAGVELFRANLSGKSRVTIEMVQPYMPSTKVELW